MRLPWNRANSRGDPTTETATDSLLSGFYCVAGPRSTTSTQSCTHNGMYRSQGSSVYSGGTGTATKETSHPAISRRNLSAYYGKENDQAHSDSDDDMGKVEETSPHQRKYHLHQVKPRSKRYRLFGRFYDKHTDGPKRNLVTSSVDDHHLSHEGEKEDEAPPEAPREVVVDGLGAAAEEASNAIKALKDQLAIHLQGSPCDSVVS